MRLNTGGESESTVLNGGYTYTLPVDQKEANRLDTQHDLFNLLLDGRLYLSPLSEPVRSALDIGTGTGIWAASFATQHPFASVIGTDISPALARTCPNNCSFVVADAEADWRSNALFDFIHARALVAAIHDWPRLFRQAYTNLAPGGWFESQEFVPICVSDDGMQGTTLATFYQGFADAMRMQGIDVESAKNFTTSMDEAGFVNVTRQDFMLPLTDWPMDDKRLKEVGNATRDNLDTGMYVHYGQKPN
ncbi:MAG: hypothetical protein Q9227_007750 [Pyrenula ochraceoflavens]